MLFFAIWTFFYKIYFKGEDNSDKNNVHIEDWKKNSQLQMAIISLINFCHSRKEAYAEINSVQVSC